MSKPIPIGKFIVAIIWDILDFLIGWIPGFGTIFDVCGTVVALMLWGNAGVIALWEVFDVVDPTDALVPTLTITGIFVQLTEG